MKKSLYLNMLFVPGLVLVFSIASVGQNNQRFQVVNSCQLKANLASEYQRRQMPGFTVSRQGQLKPNSGYKILHDKKTDQYIILPEGIEMTSTTSWDTRPVPGGQATCLCSGEDSGPDDCKYHTVIKGNTVSHVCEGSCGCGIIVILDPKVTL